MPNPKTLKLGDKIRIVSVPKKDLDALASGSAYLEETVQVLKWMIGKEFTIWQVDEFGNPWIEVIGYPDPDGAEHTMAIFDSDSWVKI
jgi:hypothetical protein